jgi:MFS transporter, PAT family, beta-lactamase induction signal transducer AmpG
MLAGGAGLLLLASKLGQSSTMIVCGGLIALAGVGAFVLRTSEVQEQEQIDDEPSVPAPFLSVLRHVISKQTRVVLALAVTFKWGIHAASALVTPLVVDAGWSSSRIGWAKVTLGTVSSLIGAGAGGWIHRKMRERTALALAVVFQTLSCVPLVMASMYGAPYTLTAAAIGIEHFASGMGTTVLFAALMTATRPADAGLHYTILTTANAAAIAGGSYLGSALGDLWGNTTAFTVATLLGLLPLVWVSQWERAVQSSRGR